MEMVIKRDLYRYSLTYRIGDFFRILQIPGALFMVLHRKASNYKKHSISGIFYRLLLRRYSYKFGFQIPVSTKIGEGFYIGHFGNVVISPQSIIGKNCNIAHGVTIGRISNGPRQGAPKIGDFVWMGTNSILVGNITVGNNVLIAPGAYVNFDVPDNSLVIGNPGKVISKENPIKGYINNVLD